MTYITIKGTTYLSKGKTRLESHNKARKRHGNPSKGEWETIQVSDILLKEVEKSPSPLPKRYLVNKVYISEQEYLTEALKEFEAKLSIRHDVTNQAQFSAMLEEIKNLPLELKSDAQTTLILTLLTVIIEKLNTLQEDLQDLSAQVV